MLSSKIVTDRPAISISIHGIKIVSKSDNAPHKGDIASEDEIVRAIRRAEKSVNHMQHAGSIGPKSDGEENERARCGVEVEKCKSRITLAFRTIG
jgi:hypothetical protein